MRKIVLAPLAALLLVGCADARTTEPNLAAPANASLERSSTVDGEGALGGVVYTLSNAATGNAVLVFSRGEGGVLFPAGSFPTGGSGAGRGLGSQGAVVLSDDGKLLFAVNAGSDEISSFRVSDEGLDLVSTVSSGGSQPLSVTTSGHLLYVLNGGGGGNIVGFRIATEGGLSMIPGSSRRLSSSASGPAQIGFAPGGDVLVVTEKATGVISTYRVGGGGLATGPIVTASVGATPFGFAFGHRGALIVSDAFGGAPDASAATSYRVDHDGSLAFVSGPVPTTETAACWFVVTRNGRFAYTTNTGSGSVSGYRVERDGALTLLDADGRTGRTGVGSAPTDEALSRNSHYLYTLNSGAHGISVFAVHADGSLAPQSGVSGLPASAVGLAAR